MNGTHLELPVKDLATVCEHVTQRLVDRADGRASRPVVAPVAAWGIAVVLYQSGCRRLLVVRTGLPNLLELVESVTRGVLRHPRVAEFQTHLSKSTRIQIDLIPDEPQPIDFESLRENDLGPNRFEYGVDGLRIVGRTATRYFLPGDAFVRSVLGLNQLRRHVERLFPGEQIAYLQFSRFRSHSFIRFEDRWIPLFRGYPVLSDEVTADELFDRARASVERIIRTQHPSGRFEYYYDAKTDTYNDHEHPSRDPQSDPYYNMLRHSGGILTLLFYESATRDPRLVQFTRTLAAQQIVCFSNHAAAEEESTRSHQAIVAALQQFLTTLVEYSTADGSQAVYSVDNRKGKLGGSGLGLYSLALYQHLFGDDRFESSAQRFVTHLLSEIQPSGEFMYYHTYHDKKVHPKDNHRHFSFYYPGEAVVGLAAYLKHVCRSDVERERIVTGLHKALRFLVFDRPKNYPQHFTPLPADSWLMMGINELWDLPDFQRDEYKGFVFGDADKMCDHQYTPKSAFVPDYIGSFFYQYGDHPYPDGARAEGLLAAYVLAVKTSDKARQKRYFKCLVRLAWACLHLCNTRESLYSVPNPAHAFGSIRFKFTRQCVRVDTTEHVASFFVKFLPHFIAHATEKERG